MEILTKIKRYVFRREHEELVAMLEELSKEKQELRAERERVSRLVPVPSDVSDMMRKALDIRLGELGVCKTEEEKAALLAQIQLLRRHLRQEMAVNEYLLENQKEGTSEFNALDVTLRRSYFEKVDAKL